MNDSEERALVRVVWYGLGLVVGAWCVYVYMRRNAAPLPVFIYDKRTPCKGCREKRPAAEPIREPAETAEI